MLNFKLPFMQYVVVNTCILKYTFSSRSAYTYNIPKIRSYKTTSYACVRTQLYKYLLYCLYVRMSICMHAQLYAYTLAVYKTYT